MKICIILPKGFPIPAVNGGAIEELTNDIINQNEINKKLDITVTSIYDKKAKEVSEHYNNTKFVYIKNNFSYKLKAFIIRIKSLFGQNLNTYNEMVLQQIKNTKYNYIIVEDGAYHQFKTYLKYFKKEQMILHFHHNATADSATDETFSTAMGVSEYVVNTFKKSSRIPEVKVLKNGIQIEKFDKEFTINQRENFRKMLGLKKEDFVAVFCGRLIPEKGVLELVKAIKQIENQNIKLMIIGSINFANEGTSEYVEQLKEEINNSNRKILLTGYVDNAELYKYYKSADIGVVPSIWEEAAALVTIEMMVSKLPIIVTKTGGIPEYVSKETILVQNDENIVNSLKEEIERLYYNKIKREEMALKSYRHAKQFNTQQYYDDFVQILKEKGRKTK